MAAAKTYSVEQIIAKLREVERLQRQGLSIPQAAKKIGVTDRTIYRWRLRLRSAEGGRGAAAEALGAGERPAEEDRGRPGVRYLAAERPAAGRMVSLHPEWVPGRRAAVAYLMKRHRISER